MLTTVTSLFPLWAIIFSVTAFFFPNIFSGLKPAIVPLLAIVMLGMGMTLKPENFKRIFERPFSIAIGVTLQYTIMPLSALLISNMLSLPLELKIGMVLVGCCPGGTASNVICYLAKADVALSIILTLITTLISFCLTPFLCWLLVGQTVPVPVLKMLTTILTIIIIPVALGVAINTLWGRKVSPLKKIFPLISVAAIVLIIAIIVALNRDNLATSGWILAIGVISHNLFGLSAGYGIARALKRTKTESRTIAIEVGMQNSGLAVALALKYFTPLSALTGAIFSIWHNLSGSFLSRYWRGRKT